MKLLKNNKMLMQACPLYCIILKEDRIMFKTVENTNAI